jgi:hypothetical protein
MAEQITRTCDFPVGKGRNEHACGKPVPDNKPTMFALNNEIREADLCEEHQRPLHAAFVQYFPISRRLQAQVSKTGIPFGARKVMTAPGTRLTFTSKQVRDWLREQGYEVPESGRIKENLIQEYVQAHSG